MHTLIKQNGTEIEVNDSSLPYALSLGWVKPESKPKIAKPQVKVKAKPKKAKAKKRAK